MADAQTIKANVAAMIDQGAPEADIDRYLASEGTSAQALRGGRLAPADEEAYASLAANPSTAKADLKGFASQHGITLRDGDIDAFLAARNKGSRVSKRVVYENLPRAPKASLAQNIGAMVGTAVDGVLPGVARTDRGIHGVISNAAKSLVGSEEFDPAAAFQQSKDEQDYAQARFGMEHPDASVAATVAGLAGSFALPEVRAVRGSGALAGAANSALTGAGYGALAGALNETGGGRLENMGTSALVGGGFGAGAPLALRGTAALAGGVRRNVPGMDATARFLANVPRRVLRSPLEQLGDAAAAQAERVLNRQLDGAAIATGMGTGTVPATPAAIADEVGRRQGLGVPAVPADVSPNIQRATARALRGEGPATSRARSMLMARQAEQGARIRQHITAELGPTVDPIEEAAAIIARAKREAAPMYQEAYDQPMVLTPEIEAIMATPAFRDALPQAVRNIRNAQRDPQPLGFRIDADNRITGTDGLSVEAFDQIIRAMRDNATSAGTLNPLTGRVIHNSNSVHINSRAQDLQGHLGAQNGAYRDAVGTYADEMAIRDALDRGGKVSSLSGHEINAQARVMPRHAQEGWTAGARTALADEAVAAGLEPARNVAQRTRQSLGLSGAGRAAAGGDPTKQAAVEALSRRPGVIGRIDDRLEAEDQAYETFAQVARGGPPVPQDDQTLREASQLLGAAGKVATGGWRGAALDVLKGGERGTFQFRRGVDDRTASLLTAMDPAEVRQGMAALEARTVSDDRRRRRMNQGALRMSRTGVLTLAGEPMDEMSADDQWAGDVLRYPDYAVDPR
ncbi:hypothetical protein ACMGDM_10300 [Sphingomonas sp. DT-51]|uniref:hypothetical protein n=1 Tax=Sphingomonas sp. DT-51 TaxID=3396165 RepID=UPI003F1DE0BA